MSSQFVARFNTDNPAFDQDGYGEEVARILRKIADHLEQGGAIDPPQTIRDVNGNCVGYFSGVGYNPKRDATLD